MGLRLVDGPDSFILSETDRSVKSPHLDFVMRKGLKSGGITVSGVNDRLFSYTETVKVIHDRVVSPVGTMSAFSF